MNRRTFVLGVSAGAASVAWPVLGQKPVRTPGQILGPYYPVLRSPDTDIDLTRVAGRPAQAAGEVLRVVGRILDERGRAIPDAAVEILQADAQGHYHHPSDRAPEAVDPNFQGFAAFHSDQDGRYAFTTIKPGSYRDDGAGGMRAPHIHFQVTGKVNRLITQTYFDGENLNDGDRVLGFVPRGQERLIARVSEVQRGMPRVATWDIVLRDG